MVGLSTDFVFHGQYWLVYHPVLSVVDDIGWCTTDFVCQGNNGWYISRFCLLLTMWLVFNTVLSVVDYWLAYQPVLSVMDNIGLYISLLCLS